MRPHVERLRARGIEAMAIDLPRGRAEHAVAAYLAASGSGPDVVIGGHSYGGRVASLLAASGERFGGLVLFSYPLHRPGGPEWESRTAHWPAIACPALLLSGESDPFARVDLLRLAVSSRLPGAELVLYPKLGHGLLPVLDNALDRTAAFVCALAAGTPPEQAGPGREPAARARAERAGTGEERS